MNPLSLSPAARQNALARSLYRKLFRECQRIPPNASLVHLNQWVDDTQIKDRDTLRSCLRSSFRRRNNYNPISFSSNNEKINSSEFETTMGAKEGIQRGMEGLKYCLSLDLSQLSEAPTEAHVSPQEFETGRTSNSQGQDSYSLQSPISSDDLLRSVEWLPHVSEMKDTETKDTEIESSQLPIFPLSGPIFPDDQGKRLPLLSQFSDAPVVGMEIPLQIFEPRYRKMYQDLLSSADTSKRRFVVPFPHPYRPGQFAAFGWIYEIVDVKDVADESNGQFQVVCNHTVTQPVKILGITNPEDYDTQLTYLRARADIVHNTEDEDGGNTQEGEENTNSTIRQKIGSADLQPLEELLQQLQNRPLSLSSDNNNRQIDKNLIDRLLMASREGSIWPVAQVWIANLQTEILRLQMKISTRIQVQAKAEQQKSPNNNSTERQVFVTEEMVLLAQEPYKSHLRCMLIEISTLIPWLLQEQSHKAQCHQMCERIRERLVNETEHSFK